MFVTPQWRTAVDSPAKKNRMGAHFTTSTKHLTSHKYYTLLTSVFNHLNADRLLGNILALMAFGPALSDLLGLRWFLALYLGSGVLMSCVAVFEKRHHRPAVAQFGANNAVNSVATMGILLAPRTKLLLFSAVLQAFGVVPLPMWFMGSAMIGVNALA